MHSAPIAGLAALAVLTAPRALWMPLPDWWSRSVVDDFTHSADDYAVAVPDASTDRSFDAIAWTTPWFMALNAAALLSASVRLARSRGRPSDQQGPRKRRLRCRSGAAARQGDAMTTRSWS